MIPLVVIILAAAIIAAHESMIMAWILLTIATVVQLILARPPSPDE